MPFLFPKRYEIFKLNIRRCLLSHAEVIIELSHSKKSHLGAKCILITQQYLQERQAHSHTRFVGHHFLGPVGSPGVQPLI